MGAVFGRISFFVNAGVRFVEEHAKLRAMAELWDELGRERYGVAEERHRRFRYGVQVNSLGLTEAQPENNVQRIVLEALAVTLGRNARARAIQLPAWNEALGLPRPWDQQWSLRIQQVLAYETDLLEYPDIFEGSKVMDGLAAELLSGAREEMARVEEQGGAVEAVPYMKAALVESHRERLRRIESGEQVMVGVNRFEETEPSPLTADGGILVVDPAVEEEARSALTEWRASRGDVSGALEELRRVAASEENIMPATLAAARAGVTTGEWAGALREAFGSYRAPTGVGEAAAPAAGEELAELRDEVARLSEALGRRVKILVGKPGLDGHSNGAEQIAVRARDAGMDVVYEGIRLTPAQIARSAVDEGVHVIGLSILSGSHRELIPDVLAALGDADIPVVVGGIIPEADAEALEGRRRGRRLHARRTSRSRASCARSWRSSPTATGYARPRDRPGPDRRPRTVSGARARRAAARARPDRRAGGAESAREPDAAGGGGGAAGRGGAGAARRRGGRTRGRVSPARRERGSRRCCPPWRAPGEPPGGRSRCWRWTRPRSARAARCSAIARGSRPTRPTAGCSSARPPRASGSAASLPPRGRPRRRWRRPSTSW